MRSSVRHWSVAARGLVVILMGAAPGCECGTVPVVSRDGGDRDATADGAADAGRADTLQDRAVVDAALPDSAVDASAADAQSGDAAVPDSGSEDAATADSGALPRWIGPLDPGGGGQVQDIELDPRDDGVVFALINSGGLARSRDSGETWTVLNRGLDYAGAGYRAAGGVFLGMHPTRPEVLLRSNQASQIVLSTDSGDNWRLTYSNPAVVDEYADFTYDPVDPDLVYVAVGGNNGVLNADYTTRRVTANLILRGRYQVTSRSYSWQVLLDDLGTLEDQLVLSMDVYIDGVARYLYLTTPRGLRRGRVENDAIASLETLNAAPGLPAAQDLDGANVVVDDHTPGRIYLAVGNEANVNGGVYRSTDGGASFTLLTRPNGYDPLGTGDQNNRFFVLGISPFDARVIYASMVKLVGAGSGTKMGGTLMRSIDDGATWAPVVQFDHMTLGWKDLAASPKRFSVTNIATSVQDANVVYISTSSGSHLFRTSDASAAVPSWAVRSTRLVSAGPPAKWSAGYPAIAFQWSIAVHPTDPLEIVVPYGDHGIFVSGDGGRTFDLRVEHNSLNETYGGTIVFDERDPSVWYFALQGPHMQLDDGAVFKLTGSGASWSYLGGDPANLRGFPRGAAPSLLVEYGVGASRTIYVANYGVAGAGGGVYLSIDGADFEQVFSVPGARAMAQRGGFATLYVGADGGGLYKLTRVANNWTSQPLCTAGSAGCPSTFYAMKTSNDGSRIFVASEIGLLAIDASDQLSVLWSGPDVWDVVSNPHAGDILYIATDRGQGVLRSADGGTSWRSVAYDLPTLNTMRLAVDPTALDTVYVGTKSTGIWTLSY